MLFEISKQCLASRSYQLAATFVPGDFEFLSSKVYIFTCVIGVLDHLTLLIFGLNVHKLKINVDTAFFFFCNCDLLSKASNLDIEIDQNKL